MLKNHSFIIALITLMITCFATSGFGQNPVGVEGKITNSKGEAVPFAIVKAYKDGILKGAKKADINGYYKMPLLDPGMHSMKIYGLHCQKLELSEIEINSRHRTIQNIRLNPNKNGVIDIYVAPAPPVILPSHPGRQIIKKNNLRKWVTNLLQNKISNLFFHSVINICIWRIISFIICLKFSWCLF